MVSAEHSFESIELSSQLVRDLISHKDSAMKFVDLPFDYDLIPDQIAKKDFSADQRQLLHDALVSQYQATGMSEQVQANVDSLINDNTFTVCTGHQLNLLSGPLYSIYKIAQTMAMARTLNEKYPDKRFVPVFWMATEDHDFAEINHINLFGKTLSWERDSLDRVVGRLDMSGCQDFLDQIEGLYQNPEVMPILNSMIGHYKESTTLAEATRKFINSLFGKEGLLILDGDHKGLKAQMIPAFQREVSEGMVYKAVSKTNQALENSSYHLQVFLRECNLFYIGKDDVRSRIVKENGTFTFGGEQYSAEAVVELINTNPGDFSPNALMRPLYQETVLPNLVYVGGGGEIAYWLQLKALFESARITFPMLRTRDSYVILSEKEQEALESNNLSLADLKKEQGVVEKELVLNEAAENLNLDEENALFIQLKNKLKEHSDQIDKGISQSVEAELTKMQKSMENIENKLIKAEKKKLAGDLKRIEKLQQKIYPNRGFQERHENIIPYLLKDQKFIKELLDINLDKTPVIKILTVN